MVECPKRREGFARRHLLGVAFGPTAALSADAVAEADLGRVFAAMPWTGGTDDVVLRRGQESLLRHLLQTALVVVVRPRLHVDQAPAEELVGRTVTLVEEDGANHGFEGVRKDRLQG